MGTAPAARWIELGLLLGLTPVALRFTAARWLLIEIVLGAAMCAVLLLRDPSFERRRLGVGLAPKPALGRALLRFAVLAPVMTVGVAWLRPDVFLSLPRRQPALWAVVLVAYPVLSVFPQELIFRAFFFHRYQSLFPKPLALCIASAVVFGWAHIVLGSWVSMVLSALGGLMFATTYARSGSLLIASAEHALWGGLAFTLGLGVYFYAGLSRGP